MKEQAQSDAFEAEMAYNELFAPALAAEGLSIGRDSPSSLVEKVPAIPGTVLVWARLPAHLLV